MIRDERMAAAVEQAETAIHAAYLAACDEAGRALDPHDMIVPEWVCQMLAEAYEARLDLDDE